MDKKTIYTIFCRFQVANPHPTTELIYHNEFELLIAVILSAQATDISVNKATKNLFQVASTPQAMLELGEEKLIQYIKTIGLFRSKARHIIACCQALINQHHGQVPHTRTELEALAGVGRKTANVILNTAFGEATLAVDTHIFRISHRIGFSQGKTVRAVEDDLLKIIPPEFLYDAHHWLILHGRYICRAKKPLCNQCIISDLCEFPDKLL